MMNFKKWAMKNTDGELLVHIRRRCFPNSSYRKMKTYWNCKYKGHYINDGVILQFERKWDAFEELIEGGRCENI